MNLLVVVLSVGTLDPSRLQVTEQTLNFLLNLTVRDGLLLFVEIGQVVATDDGGFLMHLEWPILCQHESLVHHELEVVDV